MTWEAGFVVAEAFAPSPSAPSLYKHPKLKARRDELRALGLCICGPLPVEAAGRRRTTSHVVHGPVVGDTGKCARCIEVARRSR